MILYGFFSLGASTGETAFLYTVLPLHGFCFTFFFVTGQLYVDEKAPASLRNAAQGLITFATYGVGKYTGTLVAGNIVDHYSVQNVYNWTSIWMVPLIMTIIFTLGFVLLFRENLKYKQEKINH